VPPVLSDRAARLDPRQNPLFQHGEHLWILRVRGGVCRRPGPA
jgi:hypothetical protein